MAATLGMIGTGEWADEERPKRFREGILKMLPNGNVPITAITSKGRSERTDDPEFKYYDRNLATQGGTVTTVYEDSNFVTAVGSSDAFSAGDSLHCKVPAATVADFRVGHTVLLLDKDAPTTYETFGKVTAVDSNGADSRISIILRVASSAGTAYNADYIDIVGNSNPEGGYIPDAIYQKPTKRYNYCQIFRTPLDLTRTQRRTKMRTGDLYQDMKTDALLYHGVEIESAIIWGYKSEATGSNTQKERTTEGMVQFITNNESDNVVDYPSNTSLTWLQGGEDWIDEKLEQFFRYGRDTKMAVAGSGALLGIMKLVKQAGNFELTAETASYGVSVMRWKTPFGEILLKRHPLFTEKTHRRNCILVFEPENLRYRYVDDTFFKEDDSPKKAGRLGFDGTKEEFVTECGFEFHYPKTMGYMTGVGSDGTA